MDTRFCVGKPDDECLQWGCCSLTFVVVVVVAVIVYIDLSKLMLHNKLTLFNLIKCQGLSPQNCFSHSANLTAVIIFQNVHLVVASRNKCIYVVKSHQMLTEEQGCHHSKGSRHMGKRSRRLNRFSNVG